LHESGMNPKRTARKLGITENTLNAHRRSICQKCSLQGVGEFWVFVERCR
jgi:DNA-binding CsgD family transcriptional regulator